MQYTDNVVGPGSPRYDNAYFTINSVRVYTVDGLSSSISNSLRHSSTSANTGGASNPTSTGSISGSNAGVVPDIPSSLPLFFLLCVGILAVFI